jgi:hypothetical protein
VIPDPVKRDHNGVIWIDDWRYCDQCGSGVTVGTDAEAIALAVALVQATPGDANLASAVDIRGRVVIRTEDSDYDREAAIMMGLALIRAAGAKP